MFKLLLIWRYFVKKRITLVAVTAVALLVMLVLVVLSIMSGLLNEIRQRNHDWSGDIVITRDSLVGFGYYDEFIAKLYESGLVEVATPVLKTFALIDSQSPGQLFGLRLGEFCRVSGFEKSLSRQKNNTANFLVPGLGRGSEQLTKEQRLRGCIVGKYAHKYYWRVSTGSLFQGGRLLYYFPLRFTLFGISSGGMLTGSEAGQHQKFWFIDKYETGLFDVDAAMLVDFDELQQLCWMGGQDGEAARTNEIRIKLKDGVDADAGLAAVKEMWQVFAGQHEEAGHGQLLKDVTVQSWQEYRRAFIAPVEKEKTLMIIVFGMVGIVAIFIIFAIFYMIVTEKIKDLGIVKSVGGSSGTLGQIFLGFGMLVGIIGAGVGTALGCAIVLNSNEIENVLYKLFGFRLWPPEVYAINRIPDVVDFSEAFLIVIIAVLASVAGAAIPAWRAARLTVVDALRVE